MNHFCKQKLVLLTYVTFERFLDFRIARAQIMRWARFAFPDKALS